MCTSETCEDSDPAVNKSIMTDTIAASGINKDLGPNGFFYKPGIDENTSTIGLLKLYPVARKEWPLWILEI